MPLSEASRITLAVLAALGYAHEQRIVHRDIKPANILIGDDGAVKLTDFGLAEALGTGSVAGGGGTYPYMAPEDFAEDADSDYRSDLWAVGVVLYEMLAGRRPFNAARLKDPFSWKRAIEQSDPPRLSSLRPDLPAAVSEVVTRALARSKSSRYPTAAVFADSLRAAAGAASAAGAVSAAAPITIAANLPFDLDMGTDEGSDEPSFVFGNGALIASTLDELLAGAARHWDEARRALIDGRMERFLRAIGEVHIAGLSAELAARATEDGANPDRLLREFLNRSRSEEAPGDTVSLPALAGGAAAPLPQRTARFRLRRPAAPAPEAERPAPALPAAVATRADVREDAPTIAVPVPAPRREPPRVPEPLRPVSAVVSTAEPSEEEKPRLLVKHRWWFWPLFVLVLAPPAAAITAVPSFALGRMGRFNNLLEAWAAAGFLAIMVLLVGIARRLPALPRVMCMLPIAAGLVAAGALANQALGPRPTPDDLVQVSIAVLFPLFILLVEAATVAKQWRLWITLTILVAIITTLHYGRFFG
jgi:hypothetical protein